MKVSLVILVHNVEEHIVLCLKSACELPDSITPIIDEVVLVNHNSTDNTITLAIDYLNKLDRPIKHKIANYQGKFEFDKARNLGIKHCDCDVIIMLDADERLVITHEEIFRKFLDNVSHGWTVGRIANKNPTVQYDGTILFIENEMRRVFPNNESYYYTTPIHEILQHPPDALITTVPGVYIAHLGYDTTKEEMEAKYDRNMQALVAGIDENMDNGVAWYYLGNTLGMQGKLLEQSQAYTLALHFGNVGIGFEKYIESKLEYINKYLNNRRH